MRLVTGARVRRVAVSIVAAGTAVVLGTGTAIAAPPRSLNCEFQAEELSDALEIAQECDIDVRVVGKTTPWSTTVAHDDGSVVVETSTRAQRAPASAVTGGLSGDWTSLNTKVVDGAPDDGRVEVAAGVYHMSFSDGSTPAQPLARVLMKGRYELVYDAPFDLPVPSIDGDRLTYADVAGKGVDLVVTITEDGTGFVPTLRIADAAAAQRAARELDLDALRFDVTTSPGLTVLAAGDGGFVVSDPFGQRLLSLAAPAAWDTSAADVVGAPDSTAGAPGGELSGLARPDVMTVGEWEQVTGVDASALDDPEERLDGPLLGDQRERLAATLSPVVDPATTTDGQSDSSAGGFGTTEAAGSAGALTVGGTAVTSTGFGAAEGPTSSALVVDADTSEMDAVAYPLMITPGTPTAAVERIAVRAGEPIDPELATVAGYMFESPAPVGYCDSATNTACGETSGASRLAWQFTGLDEVGLTDADQVSAASLKVTGVDSASCTPTGLEAWRIGQFGPTSTFEDLDERWTGDTDPGERITTTTVAHKDGCTSALPRTISLNVLTAAKYLASTDAGVLTLGLKATDEVSMAAGWKTYGPDATLTVQYVPAGETATGEGADLKARQDNRADATDDVEVVPSPEPVDPVSPTPSPEPSVEPDPTPQAAAPDAAATTAPVPETLTPVDGLGGLDLSIGAAAGVTSPDQVDLEVADQAEADALGLTGVLLDVTDVSTTSAQQVRSAAAAAVEDEPATTSLQVQVDYGEFADLGGGADWGSRLGLVRIPACASTTPEAEECQPVEVDGVLNDTDAGTITGTLQIATAATAAAAEQAATELEAANDATDEARTAVRDADEALATLQAAENEDVAQPSASPTPSMSPSASVSAEQDGGTPHEEARADDATVVAEAEEAAAEAQDELDEARATVRAARTTVRALAGTTTQAGSGDKFAVTARSASAAGDWKATPLSASSSWTVSGATGSLGWSYPVGVPTPGTGPAPKLTLGYSSSALDGRISGANNQSSWIGAGWDLSSGFVERKYTTCTQDTDPVSGADPNNTSRKTGDLCWDTDNAYLVFNGSSTELVKDDVAATSEVEWRPKADDGTVVAQYGPRTAGEWWRVSTTDGTVYDFGRQANGQKSRWTVPVYGNHAGEPGHASAFKDSQVTLGWRWMLDHVVDTSDNTMTYGYATETNRYGSNANTGDTSQYVRGGTLDWIEYGTTASTESAPPYRVEFHTAERCLGTAANPCPDTWTKSTASRWHDTPTDLRCTSTTSCQFVQSPVFYSTKRLTSITAHVRNPATGTLAKVSTWSLEHGWRDPGDGTGRVLWLRSIQHTGHAVAGAPGLVGDDITAPKVTFVGEQFPGRVNDTATDGYPAMKQVRLTSVTTETGGGLHITYRDRECTGSNIPRTADGTVKVPGSQGEHTLACQAVKWHPSGVENPRVDYVHTYLVDTVVQSASPQGAAGFSPDVTTSYDYAGGAAWTKVDDALVAKKYRTYSVFRGYETVTSTLGTGADRQVTTTRYLRGVDGVVESVDGSLTSDTVTDHELLAGTPLVTTTYSDQAGQNVLSKKASLPTVRETGRYTPAPGEQPIVAGQVASADVWSGTFTNAGNLAYKTHVITTYGDKGEVVTSDDRGQAGTEDTTISGAPMGSDDTCTRNRYLSGASNLLVQVETVMVKGACPADGTPEAATVISASRTSYDGQAWNTAPVRGRPTTVTPLAADRGAGWAFPESGATTTAYDSKGRVTAVTDPLGRTTGTAYIESGGIVTATTTTSADPDGAGDGNADGYDLSSHQVRTELSPFTGQIVTSTDAAGKVTTATYDALGRSKAVWFPDRSKAGGQSSSVSYDYVVSRSGVNAVKTSTLGADGSRRHASTGIFDGLLRQIQTQTESLDGHHTGADVARVVVSTLYDTAGRAWQTSGGMVAPGSPAMGLVTARNGAHQAPSYTQVTYDGAGRATSERFYIGNPTNPEYLRWRTTTAYNAHLTTVVPPDGATPTRTINDAKGRTIELREYLRDPRKNAAADTPAEVEDLEYQGTTYTYNAAGLLTVVTDPDANEWTYAYDRHGRQTAAVDPDAGATSTKYDAAGQVTSTTNGAGQTLTYGYDNLGRKVSQTGGTGTVTWFYDRLHTAVDADKTAVKGQLTATVRTISGKAYTTAATGYTVKAGAYLPTGSETTLPTDTALGHLSAKSWTTSWTYTADGQVATQTLPAVTGPNGTSVLNREEVTTHYDAASLPEWMGGGFGWGTYVADSRRDAWGRQGFLDLGNTYGTVVSYLWEEGTNRLTNLRLDRERIGGTELDLRYTYDQAGNITSITDDPTAVGRATDKQCFRYDALRRLSEAWTPADGRCGVLPSVKSGATALGGAAPYWASWQHDELGNRISERLVLGNASTARGSAVVQSTGYDYGRDANGDGDLTDTGDVGPHAVASTTTTGTNERATTTYTYDDAGRTTGWDTTEGLTRTQQTLTWDPESELTRAQATSTTDVEDPDTGVVTPGAARTSRTSNIWGGDGERLIRTSEPDTAISGDESVTVYLAGGQEITWHPGTSTVTAQRYYSFAGQAIATRDGNGLGAVTSLITDPHGTPVASVHNTRWTTTSVAKHYTLPFGQVRGGRAMPTDRVFLGKTRDVESGLTLIGARWYGETQGRFLTVDPVMDLADPQQWNGYAYANNSPVTYTDPTGLAYTGYTLDPGSGGGCGCDNGYEDPGEESTSGGSGGGGSFGDGVGGNGNGGLDLAPQDVAELIAIALGTESWPVPKYVPNTTYDPSTTLREKWNCVSPLPWDAIDCDVSLAQKWEKALLYGSLEDQQAAIAEMALPTSGETFVASLPLAVVPAGKGASQVASGAARAAARDAASASMRTAARACSFEGSTLVLMGDGSKKPIREVEAGDEVIATDPDSGEQGARKVTHVFVHEDTIANLELDDGTVLGTTEDHRFWLDSGHRFERADELVAGEEVLTADGRTLPVDGLRDSTSRLAMAYNLEVDGIHTYHVGEQAILVHNACLLALRNWQSQRFQFGSSTFQLDKSGLTHVLERHHPAYWDGSVKGKQSFFDESMSIDDVQAAIGDVARQNREQMAQIGAGSGQVQGSVNGVDYVLGVSRGRIGQFYPGTLP